MLARHIGVKRVEGKNMSWWKMTKDSRPSPDSHVLSLFPSVKKKKSHSPQNWIKLAVLMHIYAISRPNNEYFFVYDETTSLQFFNGLKSRTGIRSLHVWFCNFFPMNPCSSLMTAYCWEKHVVCLRARGSCGAGRRFPPLRSSIDPHWLCRGARWKPLTVIYGMSSPGGPDEPIPLGPEPHHKPRGSII